MADLLDGIARHLDARGLLDYDPYGTTGDTFIETTPSRPDEAVTLTLYGGPESDSRLPFDEVSLQVRTRGGRDPRPSRQKCAAIRDELHGLGPLTLPDGTFLQLAIAIQAAPAYMGQDTSGRHEHVCNFRLDIRNVSAHRQ
ncbi:minor capsid protein [Streptomyces sp. NPDC017943]|uniref:minor capsid protein n=1 Tax=Streptomyces sp. NPDC017943 TaxID=3365019 RepID=UPI00378E5478